MISFEAPYGDPSYRPLTDAESDHMGGSVLGWIGDTRFNYWCLCGKSATENPCEHCGREYYGVVLVKEREAPV